MTTLKPFKQAILYGCFIISFLVISGYSFGQETPKKEKTGASPKPQKKKNDHIAGPKTDNQVDRDSVHTSGPTPIGPHIKINNQAYRDSVHTPAPTPIGPHRSKKMQNR